MHLRAIVSTVTSYQFALLNESTPVFSLTREKVYV